MKKIILFGLVFLFFICNCEFIFAMQEDDEKRDESSEEVWKREIRKRAREAGASITSDTVEESESKRSKFLDKISLSLRQSVAPSPIFSRSSGRSSSSQEDSRFLSSRVKKSLVKFDLVIGRNEEKEILGRVVCGFEFLRDSCCCHSSISSNILLFGPAGNGKKFLVEALAGEIGCNLFVLTGVDFNYHMKKSLDVLLNILNLAIEMSPRIVILLEDMNRFSLDIIEFIINLIRFKNNVVFVATYNFKKEFLKLEAEREKVVGEIGSKEFFERFLFVGFPSEQERALLMREFLEKNVLTETVDQSHIDFDILSQRTEGAGIRDLNQLANEAILLAKSKDEEISMKHFDAILSQNYLLIHERIRLQRQRSEGDILNCSYFS